MAEDLPCHSRESGSPAFYEAAETGKRDSRFRGNDEKGKRALALTVAAAIFAVDQLSKWIVISPLALQSRRQIQLLPFFNLTWVENRGVSMGFLTAASETQRWLLVAMTAAIALGVLFWLWRERNRFDSLALALVLGGALGNIVDRVRYGYVADFLDLHIGGFRPFLIFNVADAAISIGVLLLLARALLTREKKSPREEM
jgi:signal peptidase II